jgi:transglutaminase-like putative cysteine protease
MAAVRSGPIARFTQTLRVTIRSMKSSDVIAAGMAAAPLDISGPVVAGPSQGTWTLGGELGPGDSYVVRVYAPHPSLVELADAGTDYPATLLPSYLSLTLPPRAQHGVSSAPQQVIFAPFGSSRTAAYGATSVDPAPAVEHSPYARELALARRLAQGARTPYAYVARVQRYLASGFTYNETPTTGRYPLDTFLFDAKSGYCQQFAGAMALLLRMGGVPARVSAGFTSGQYRAATRSWAVSDLDAHAWVEAWFPGYGWVRFDPTPAAAPARGGHLPLPAIESSGAAPPPATDARRPDLSAGANSRGVVKAKHHGSNLELILACAAALVLLLAAGLVVLAHRRRPRTGEELVSELVRAFARSGRPIEDGVTLTRLEHRLRGAPDAAAYVRALRLSRFGDSLELPTARQRRALRQQLRAGLGVGAGVRALWALPPRWTRERAP